MGGKIFRGSSLIANLEPFNVCVVCSWTLWMTHAEHYRLFSINVEHKKELKTKRKSRGLRFFFNLIHCKSRNSMEFSKKSKIYRQNLPKILLKDSKKSKAFQKIILFIKFFQFLFIWSPRKKIGDIKKSFTIFKNTLNAFQCVGTIQFSNCFSHYEIMRNTICQFDSIAMSRCHSWCFLSPFHFANFNFVFAWSSMFATHRQSLCQTTRMIGPVETKICVDIMLQIQHSVCI